MTPCDQGMAALRGHPPRAHMRPTGGLAQTTLMNSSTTGGSVKGRPCEQPCSDTTLLGLYTAATPLGIFVVGSARLI